MTNHLEQCKEQGSIDGFNGTARKYGERDANADAIAYTTGYRKGRRDADAEQTWGERVSGEC